MNKMKFEIKQSGCCSHKNSANSQRKEALDELENKANRRTTKAPSELKGEIK